MSVRGVAAAIGLAERAPQRYTGEETNLDLLSGVASEAMADAGIDRSQVDGLLVHPIGGPGTGRICILRSVVVRTLPIGGAVNAA